MSANGRCNGSNDAKSSDAIPVLEEMLTSSISTLSPKVPLEPADVSGIARLILESMKTSGRVYHNMQHVFDISETMKDPILILSALFHDVIYYSIDKSFSDEQAKALEGVLVDLHSIEDLVLAKDFTDALVEKVVRLYGFEPGAPLPKLGTNEFLSAMIGVRVLEQWLDMPYLMQIAACIEATIPFRPVSEDGKNPMDRLYDRLKLVCSEQSEEWLERTVIMAALTANCDLCSFDSDDRDFFLDSSWKLIPEARPNLLKEDCSLMEFYNEFFALEGRTKFLTGAVPKIFQTFRQSVTDEQMAAKRAKTYENLKVMSEYAQVRMLQLMVLVDFVKVMGEDPTTMPLRPLLRMELPKVSEPTSSSEEESPLGLTKAEQEEVRNWLVFGRRACFSWDPAISPLGAYLYDSLGPQGVAAAVEIGKNQKPGSHDLLKFLPEDVLSTIASSLCTVLPDRAEGCLRVPEKLDILAQ
ncbi:hypothetical protein IV203_029269 [Nitzschia inconspicua]|uniref:Uncharacterized protein n=1 Tax=Nitzschia inconspicua TaxID=303405 RepID=A0A9K3Q360_9STRA|nr:hypothetical protein IV203_029269 [Nitzschia inconspicua]